MQPLNRPEPCLSDLTLDRALAGELDAQLQLELDAHLAGCVRCSLRFDLLSRQRSAFLEQAPNWAAFAAQRQRPTPQRRFLWPALAALAALALAGFARWAEVNAHDAGAALALHTAQTVTRRKGAASIGFYIKRGEQVSRGAAGDVVHPADVLRFVYSTERAAYFALLYADAREVRIYQPLRTSAELVQPGRDLRLGFGIELDAQLGVERAYGLFCEQPIELGPVRAALQTAGKLTVRSDCSLDVLELQKRPR